MDYKNRNKSLTNEEKYLLARSTAVAIPVYEKYPSADPILMSVLLASEVGDSAFGYMTAYSTFVANQTPIIMRGEYFAWKVIHGEYLDMLVDTAPPCTACYANACCIEATR